MTQLNQSNADHVCAGRNERGASLRGGKILAPKGTSSVWVEHRGNSKFCLVTNWDEDGSGLVCCASSDWCQRLCLVPVQPEEEADVPAMIRGHLGSRWNFTKCV